MNKKLARMMLTATLVAAGISQVASAQTMSYSEAGALIASSCGADITKFCAKVNMGGGALRDCLMHAKAKLNPQCITDYQTASASLSKRVAAQEAVPKVCSTDAKRYCNGVASGDGHYLSCLNASTRVVAATCKQALADAGWN